VSVYGLRIEARPIVGWLMAVVGEGLALTTAKVTAGAFGILLHVSAVHRAVAFPTLFDAVVAVCPCLAIRFVL
jgi:hypothetical protein